MISPHFIPKPSFFISSIRPLMKRLNKVGESRQPCLTPEVTGIGSEVVSLILTMYSVLLYRDFSRSKNFSPIP